MRTGTKTTAKSSSTKPVKKRGTKNDNNTKAIITLATDTLATQSEIAEIVNVSKQAVHQTLKRHGIEPKRLKSYGEHKADILAGMQLKILKQIDLDKLKTASVNNLAYAFQNFYNAERLERGKSTSNIAQLHADIAELKKLDSSMTIDQEDQ